MRWVEPLRMVSADSVSSQDQSERQCTLRIVEMDPRQSFKMHTIHNGKTIYNVQLETE